MHEIASESNIGIPEFVDSIGFYLLFIWISKSFASGDFTLTKSKCFFMISKPKCVHLHLALTAIFVLYPSGTFFNRSQ